MTLGTFQKTLKVTSIIYFTFITEPSDWRGNTEFYSTQSNNSTILDHY